MQIHKNIKLVLWSIIIMAGLNPVMADVKDSSAIGFTMEDSVIIAADTKDVYHSLVADMDDGGIRHIRFQEKQIICPSMIELADASARN